MLSTATWARAIAVPSDQLADGVGRDRQRDLARVRGAARERLGEVERLLGVYLRRQRRLVGVDHRLDHHRPRRLEGLAENITAGLGILDREPARAEAAGDRCEVDRLQ